MCLPQDPAVIVLGIYPTQMNYIDLKPVHTETIIYNS